jgi:hypothetical protein
MTTIQLMTADQSLIAVGKVKLASGDVDSVWLEVDFDSAWDGFINRTATFHTSKDATVLEALMIDNKCIIPHEVLAESCTLFIGVRGVPADGSAIKTSSLVKYKIVEGAEPGYTTVHPTMDLYQQFLAAMQEGIDPVFTQYKAEMAEHFAEHEAEVAAMCAKIASGTYVGTGTYGDSTPVVITCDFKPYFICVYGAGNGNNNTNIMSCCVAIRGFEEDTSSNFMVYEANVKIFDAVANWTDDSVSISGASSAKLQANVSGSTYRYFIVGK